MLDWVENEPLWEDITQFLKFKWRYFPNSKHR